MGNATPTAAQKGPPKRNPFIDYEVKEQQRQLEKRWMLEDPEFMQSRMQALTHPTCQARLGKKYGVDLSRNTPAAEAPWQVGRPAMGRKLQKQASDPGHQLGSTAARRERSELTAMKSLQKTITDSTLRLEGKGEDEELESSLVRRSVIYHKLTEQTRRPSLAMRMTNQGKFLLEGLGADVLKRNVPGEER